MRTKSNLQIFSGQVGTAPFVDVIFLILVFFIVSGSFVFFPGIPVDLPNVADMPKEPAEKIVVTVTSRNTVFFNDQQVKWDNFAREFRRYVRKRKPSDSLEGRSRSPKIAIRADRGVPYGHVVNIMSLASSMGMGSYLVTEASD